MNASALHFPAPVEAAACEPARGSVTEIIQHSAEVSLAPLLLPMLAQLSRQQRWLALVAPPTELTRSQLQQAGVLLDRVWILRPDDNHDTLELTARALDARTCHTVVSWLSAEDDRALDRLYRSAEQSGSQGILLRSR
jgi:cell division inhibitor SulA